MKKIFYYYFDDFCLVPIARELTQNGKPITLPASAFDCLVYLVEHRERPVGKEELISAVWGVSDVSDNLLRQIIVKLRCTLGDNANEQHCIKTFPRAGYRWMPDTRVTCRDSLISRSKTEPPPSLVIADPHPDKAVRVLASTQSFSVMFWYMLLPIAMAIIGYAGLHFYRPRSSNASINLNQGSAAVWPADVHVPEDWQWLGIGLMDVVSNQFRKANIPTESSQNVLSLLAQDPRHDASPFTLTVQPHVTWADGVWIVRLDATSKDGRTSQAEASSKDVLKAARTASDFLLVRLGFNDVFESTTSNESKEEYVLRIEVAELAGQPQVGIDLIKKAPADLQHSLELTYELAEMYCAQGKIEPCGKILSELLKELPPQKEPFLRAKVLTSSWFVYYRNHQFPEGTSALDEAIRLLEGRGDKQALATAYFERSHLEYFQNNLDAAATDLGFARVNYMLSGDSAGQADADFWLGLIAETRGQLGQAIPLIERAYDQLQRTGMVVMLETPLETLAYTRHMRLEFQDELATTDRYWPLGQKFIRFPNKFVRHSLTEYRAVAIADNGRTSEAYNLLRSMLAELDSHEDAEVLADVNALLAKLALERGDTESAVSWISNAMMRHGSDNIDDAHQIADAWIIRVMVLQRARKIEDLRQTVTAMEAWAAHLPEQDTWIDTELLQAKAFVAWSDGKSDKALELFQASLASAEKLDVPELTVEAGSSYALALLKVGQVDQALAVSGQLSQWSSVDWRAAWVMASVYKAMGKTSAWAETSANAQRLAGDRALPNETDTIIF